MKKILSQLKKLNLSELRLIQKEINILKKHLIPRLKYPVKERRFNSTVKYLNGVSLKDMSVEYGVAESTLKRDIESNARRILCSNNYQVCKELGIENIAKEGFTNYNLSYHSRLKNIIKYKDIYLKYLHTLR